MNSHSCRTPESLADTEFPELDATALCSALRLGSDEAAREFFRRHFRPLYRFVLLRVGGRHAECEEIVQDTFLAAIDSIERYRGEGSLYAWLCGIARWKVARVARKRRLPTLSLAEAGPTLDDLAQCDRDLPEQVFASKETAQLVQLALSLCPADHQEVLVEQYYQGRSVPQIAERRDQSTKAVESLLVRARQSLKKAFRRLRTGAQTAEDLTNLGPDSLEKDLAP